MEALLLCCLHQFGSPPFQGSVWGRHVLTRSPEVESFQGMFLAPSGTVQKLCGQSWVFIAYSLLVGTPYDDIDYKTLMFGCVCQFYFQTQVQSASGRPERW